MNKITGFVAVLVGVIVAAIILGVGVANTAQDSNFRWLWLVAAALAGLTIIIRGNRNPSAGSN